MELRISPICAGKWILAASFARIPQPHKPTRNPMPIRFFVALLSAALAFAAGAQEKKAEPRVNAPAHKDQAAEGSRIEGQHAICIGCHRIPGYQTPVPRVH